MIAIRGAINCDDNQSEMILNDTKWLLEEIISRNHLAMEDIISVHFTATKDLTKVYPAVGARDMGIVDAALFCSQEMDVENSMCKVIRVIVFAESALSQKQITNVYLKDTIKLRPDRKLPD